jgi:hypothetical protein
MRRDYLRFLPLISILLLFSSDSYGQKWSGILAPSRAIDWGQAGLPPTLPNGETTPNPWTPPTRTQCQTSQCNTVAGGNVTASTINAAISSAPSGTYVLIPSGTFALGGDVSIVNKNYVTLRGSGAAVTKLTGGDINVGTGSGAAASATLLTANPTKGATSVTVASPPSAGRIAGLEQCDDGFSASGPGFTTYGSGTTCNGSYSDPQGPWVCGLSSICDRNAISNSNPHFQAHIFWIPAGGVSGNTVNFSSAIENNNWSTSRTAALAWINNSGTVGVGIEDLTLVGSVGLNGTYACWVKGNRLIATSVSTTLFGNQWDAHSLLMNNYIGSTAGGGSDLILQLGSDSGERAASDFLMLNNIIEGGFLEGGGSQVNNVLAYNYFYTAGNGAWVENGEFQHHAGTSFLLREGNQLGYTQDDDTWGTHNFNTWFRNYSNCQDPVFPGLGNSQTIEAGAWARFTNIIGNVLAGNACSNSYNGIININRTGLDTTGLTEASAMNWGNYASCSGDSRCNTTGPAIYAASGVPADLSRFGSHSTPYQNSVPASQSLPPSFFMNNMTAHPNGGTGLAWWKTCTSWSSFPTSCGSSSTPPMPPIGPDVTGGPLSSGHAYNIPAALAYASLPADNNYATPWGHLKQFDERVFQADGSGDGSGGGGPNPPQPPSGLSAVIQ